MTPQKIDLESIFKYKSAGSTDFEITQVLTYTQPSADWDFTFQTEPNAVYYCMIGTTYLASISDDIDELNMVVYPVSGLNHLGNSMSTNRSAVGAFKGEGRSAFRLLMATGNSATIGCRVSAGAPCTCTIRDGIIFVIRIR